jgi:glucose uptake protein GlcU
MLLISTFSAIFFALFAGFLFGEDPTPIIVLQDRFEGTPKNGIYYIFSFYFGIFISSSIVFIVYCFIKKGRPYVNSELVLPSVLSGVLWAIGQGMLC